MNEKNLRKLVKKIMGDNVEWVEPTRGSTVGMPDAIFNFGGKTFPVELKYCKRTRKGSRITMRPAQIRYHRVAFKNGKQTAIIYAEDVPGSASEFGLYLLPGRLCPDSYYDYAINLISEWPIGMCLDDPKVLAARIQTYFFKTKGFWK